MILIKKKIIISGILIIVFGSCSLFTYQKKVEASIPSALYAGISELANFVVGAYIYLTSQSGGDDEVYEIDSVTDDVAHITMTITKIGDIERNAGELSVYPHNAIAPNLVSNPGAFKITSHQIGWWEGSDDEANRQIARNLACLENGDPYLDFCTWRVLNDTPPGSYLVEGWKYSSSGTTFNDPVASASPPLPYDLNGGIMGGVYSGTFNSNPVDLYEYSEDVPVVPTCSDGIQNQDETGIDCGGVCAECPPPPETCSDGIMNQDETGIDYGGVCGIGGDPADPGPQPSTFIDANSDGIDDISGYDAQGNVPIGLPVSADSNTFDASLPGDVSEIGETNWSGLITSYLASNPLVLLATGSQINLSGEVCTLTANVFGSDIIIDFCPLQSMVDLIGTFVLGLMAIRSVFVAMGI